MLRAGLEEVCTPDFARCERAVVAVGGGGGGVGRVGLVGRNHDPFVEEECHFGWHEDGTVWWVGEPGEAEEVVVEGLSRGGEEGTRGGE